ncbi:hypothetical protein FOL47_002591 [Perkinsus chesapeaki]|uniref:Transmembrane protein n=1 Tax=Perkinsus chesapeaki TaxID=330153 RepID=A0A7J6MCS7_PERCH|nr:hypothetical protein FOL47_002591 [Perkinsus chesapeaki]
MLPKRVILGCFAMWLMQPLLSLLAFLHDRAHQYGIKETSGYTFSAGPQDFNFYTVGLNPEIVSLPDWRVNRPWYTTFYLIIGVYCAAVGAWLLAPPSLRCRFRHWLHSLFRGFLGSSYDSLLEMWAVIVEREAHDNEFWWLFGLSQIPMILLQTLLLMEYGGLQALPSPRTVEPVDPVVFLVQSLLLGAHIGVCTVAYVVRWPLFAVGFETLINVAFLLSKFVWVVRVYTISEDASLGWSFALADPTLLAVLTSAQNLLVGSIRAGFVFDALIRTQALDSLAPYVTPEKDQTDSVSHPRRTRMSTLMTEFEGGKGGKANRLWVLKWSLFSAAFIILGIVWFAVVDECKATTECGSPSRRPFDGSGGCGCKIQWVYDCEQSVDDMFPEPYVEHLWINGDNCDSFTDYHLEHVANKYGDKIKSLGLKGTSTTQWKYIREMQLLAFLQADFTFLRNVPDDIVSKRWMVEFNMDSGDPPEVNRYKTSHIASKWGNRMEVMTLPLHDKCILSDCVFTETWFGYTEHRCREVDCMTLPDHPPMVTDRNIWNMSRPAGVNPVDASYITWSFLQIQSKPTEKENRTLVYVPYICDFDAGECVRRRQLAARGAVAKAGRHWSR